MIFYGTGAAEGIPSPFCRCRVCENARETGGREVRRRSMLRLSDSTCIDLGADAFQQAVEYGDFYHLRHVLVTHTHEDHFAHMMMNVRNMALERIPGPLHLHLTDKAYDIVDFYRQNQPIIKGLTADLEERGVIAFHRLDFFRESSVDGMSVLPLPGNHRGNMGEQSANYLINLPDGRSLYYGLDTGWYLEETFRALEGRRLDLFISECTFGLRPGRDSHPNSHLDAFSCRLLLQELVERQIVTDQTKVVLTHINQSSTHRELVAFFSQECSELPFEITVAYDGYRLP